VETVAGVAPGCWLALHPSTWLAMAGELEAAGGRLHAHSLLGGLYGGLWLGGGQWGREHKHFLE